MPSRLIAVHQHRHALFVGEIDDRLGILFDAVAIADVGKGDQRGAVVDQFLELAQVEFDDRWRAMDDLRARVFPGRARLAPHRESRNR